MVQNKHLCHQSQDTVTLVTFFPPAGLGTYHLGRISDITHGKVEVMSGGYHLQYPQTWLQPFWLKVSGSPKEMCHWNSKDQTILAITSDFLHPRELLNVSQNGEMMEKIIWFDNKLLPIQQTQEPSKSTPTDRLLFVSSEDFMKSCCFQKLKRKIHQGTSMSSHDLIVCSKETWKPLGPLLKVKLLVG